MSALLNFGWVVLVASAVWAGTRQRFGSSDELRALAGAIAALVIAAGLSVLGVLPAWAHDGHEIEAWLENWESRIPTAGLSLGDPLVDELAEFRDAHAWYFDPPPAPPPAPRPRPSVPAGVEQWRGLVSAYFPADQVDRALCIMGHESRGNPNADNPRSSAAGLFQFLRGTWNSVPTSITGGSYESGAVFDPEANIRAAAWLLDAAGSWAPWSPWNRGLCR